MVSQTTFNPFKKITINIQRPYFKKEHCQNALAKSRKMQSDSKPLSNDDAKILVKGRLSHARKSLSNPILTRTEE